MQKQDLETSNNAIHKQLLSAVEEVLKDYPETITLDSKLTIEDCYNKMKSEAQKKAVNSSYCFGPEETRDFIINYLGLKKDGQNILNEEKKSDFINLEDFI